jgi:hypothetical protein
MSKQLYAEPTPYWSSANSSDLTSLRNRLADAERAVAKATDWTTRTRAEQDVKILTRELHAAEVQRKADRASHHAGNVLTRDEAMSLAQGIAEGRYMATRPPEIATQGVTRRGSPGDVGAPASPAELARLKKELTELEAIAADPATSAIERQRVGYRISAVRARIEAIEVATGPKLDTKNAENSRPPLLSFEQTGQLLKLAHERGMI